MDNPTLILQTVDRNLDHPVRLVLYGRAALWLGFDTAPPEAAKTQDVDAIISLTQSEELARDPQFWDAVDAANADLASRGLYMTHLFGEQDVFLRTGWQESIVAVTRPSLRWLKLFRPATIDLILTKMMRGNDPQDMADAKFLVKQAGITRAQLQKAFAEMKPIELVELRDAFNCAKPPVLEMAIDQP
ncbi:MAG: hypothetical protein H7X97_12420 [Opitutaceae bacterium]|nr:hypothetical protein [Verrucomicrobiales bacterium]